MLSKICHWTFAATLGCCLNLQLGCDHEKIDKQAATGDIDITMQTDNGARTTLSCGITIVGGGAAGLHTAYRLAAEHGSDVCLFEKEPHLGGRIRDVSQDGGEAGPYFGAGARRIMEGQTLLFGLADELGITLEAIGWSDDLINARGYVGKNSDTLNRLAYPLVDDGLDTKEEDGAETETAFYDQLRHGPEREHAADYPDFRSYVRAVVGGQGYHFMTDVFRFRADFEYPLDARGYLDYLDEEWDVCCTPSYPVGGMSEFIRRMEAATLAHGVRIFKSEPAVEIKRGGAGGGAYNITTAHYQVATKHVVIAVDAQGLKHVGGDVVQAITSQAQFQQLIGVKAVTITQWWPNRWWEVRSAKKYGGFGLQIIV